MKINLVKDKAGKVIATYENAVGDGPSITPDLDSTMSVHQAEVPENYRLDVQAVYAQHSQ